MLLSVPVSRLPASFHPYVDCSPSLTPSSLSNSGEFVPCLYFIPVIRRSARIRFLLLSYGLANPGQIEGCIASSRHVLLFAL